MLFRLRTRSYATSWPSARALWRQREKKPTSQQQHKNSPLNQGPTSDQSSFSVNCGWGNKSFRTRRQGWWSLYLCSHFFFFYIRWNAVKPHYIFCSEGHLNTLAIRNIYLWVYLDDSYCFHMYSKCIITAVVLEWIPLKPWLLMRCLCYQECSRS